MALPGQLRHGEQAIPAHIALFDGDKMEVGRHGLNALALFSIIDGPGHARIKLDRVVEATDVTINPDYPDMPDTRKNVGPRQDIVYSVEGMGVEQVLGIALQLGGMALDVVEVHAIKPAAEPAS